MDNSRPTSSAGPPSLRALPLRQNPVSPVGSTSSPDATQTIFLTHPTAKLTSSPASSPRIVDPPTPIRHGSVHPTMSRSADRPTRPDTDFLTDASSDSAWEDSEGEITQIFPDIKDLGSTTTLFGSQFDDHGARGRRRGGASFGTSPHSNQPHVHDSGPGIEGLGFSSSPVNFAISRRATEVPLKRPGKDVVRLVHTRSNPGTPRDSCKSSNDDADDPRHESLTALPPFESYDAQASPRRPTSFRTRTRANTSDSILADSIIDAHVMTMRALESLSPVKAQDSTFLRPGISDIGYSSSSSPAPNRRLRFPSISASDGGRPSHLPSHFIKTPYPFSAKKEFPKPKTRPRRSVVSCDTERYRDRLDSGYGCGDIQKEYDRMQKKSVGQVDRNEQRRSGTRARAHSDTQGQNTYEERPNEEAGTCAVWLSLRKSHRRARSASHTVKNMAKFDMPSNLTITADHHSKEGLVAKEEMGFDDKYLAEQLRAGYHELTGNWFKRSLSARRLACIELGQIDVWSGSVPIPGTKASLQLLATGQGIDWSSDLRSPFTEDSLMGLYKNPSSGKAIYTWCHWAQRLAASNQPKSLCHSRNQLSTTTQRPRARSLDEPTTHEKAKSNSYNDFHSVRSQPDIITTIQFVQVISPAKVVVALSMMLMLSAGAALLWILVGLPDTDWAFKEDTKKSGRIVSGMAIGVLVILLESVGFGAWIWLS